MSGSRNEYSESHDLLLELADVLRRSTMPCEEYEMLIASAEAKIATRKDIAEVLHVLSRLTALVAGLVAK